MRMLQTQNTWHVNRTPKIGLHGPNHAILSSVKISEGHGLIQYTALLPSLGKNHSTEFHTFNNNNNKRQIQKGTKLHIIIGPFLSLVQVILIVNDNITVVSLMQDGQCYTLPHNCKKCHCIDIKM